MNRFTGLLLLILLPLVSFSQKTGYDLKVRFTEPIEEKTITLCRYYAKALPQIYKIDSVSADKNGVFHFKNTDSFLGGMYLILYNNRSQWFDVVMYNGIKAEITISPADITKSSVKGSKENEYNLQYLVLAEKFGKKNQELRTQLESADSADSTRITGEIRGQREAFIAERNKIVAKASGTLFEKIIAAIDRPVPPEGEHFKEDGTVDSFYGFRYVKSHYWEKFDFLEERLIHTPIYDGKLKDYFDNYVYPQPDSFQYEADILLAYARTSPELFKYTLHFLANYARSSKYMGMDESFVYLVNKYYKAGDAFWLDADTMKKYYLDPAEKMDRTRLGAVGSDLKMRDAYTYQHRSLHEVEADYIVLVFWETSCGICLKEVPALDSMYAEQNFKDKNVKYFSIPIPSDSNLETIHKTVEKLGVKKDYWLHNIDTDGSSRYKQVYSVDSTPKLYVLDKDKKIIGKNIKHENIPDVIRLHEKKVSGQ